MEFAPAADADGDGGVIGMLPSGSMLDLSNKERSKPMKAWKHFKTITYHRWLVRGGCFRVGLYWQGLTHDLSKYSPTEFLMDTV